MRRTVLSIAPVSCSRQNCMASSNAGSVFQGPGGSYISQPLTEVPIFAMLLAQARRTTAYVSGLAPIEQVYAEHSRWRGSLAIFPSCPTTVRDAIQHSLHVPTVQKSGQPPPEPLATWLGTLHGQTWLMITSSHPTATGTLFAWRPTLPV